MAFGPVEEEACFQLSEGAGHPLAEEQRRANSSHRHIRQKQLPIRMQLLGV